MIQNKHRYLQSIHLLAKKPNGLYKIYTISRNFTAEFTIFYSNFSLFTRGSVKLLKAVREKMQVEQAVTQISTACHRLDRRYFR